MSANILPVSKVVNVSITNTPFGLAERNVNSLAIFTTEHPANSEEFGIYTSPAAAIEQYGTSSVTADMLNAIFAQNPNLCTGNGRAVVIP